jgi:uncharacterized protein YraI
MNAFGRTTLICAAVIASSAASGAAMASAPSPSPAPATVKQEANLRIDPTTKAPVVTKLPKGTQVEVLCWQKGEPTFGSDKYGSMWLFTDLGGWVHSKLLTPVKVEPCGDTIPTVGGFFYKNCDAARAAGAAPVSATEPGYGPHLDRDRDGVGCE